MTPPKTLTSCVAAGGCGSKLGPAELREALQGLHSRPNKNVLFGLSTGDDAGAYKLSDDLAIVQTTDFFTPIVDDPYDFGRIAAANALSDCFALGARAITALNITCFPKELPLEYLRDILRGGRDAMEEAGGVILGGHTVRDPEPKYGLAVTGVVHPDRMITNRGAKPGDIVYLTKKIGTGIVTNSVKRHQKSDQEETAGTQLPRVLDADVYAEVVASMKTLNKAASELMVELGATACTDVTGFGLIGHASNIADASGVTIEIDYARVPKFDGIEEAALSVAGGGCSRNQAWMQERSKFSGGADTPTQFAVLCDPQTSGGLMFTLPPGVVTAKTELRGVPLFEIGVVRERDTVPIVIESNA